MKKLKLIIGLALVAGITTQAQTNAPSISGGIQEIGQAIAASTNWTVVSGYGRSTSGNRNLAFFDVAYNFNENVGIVAGYDYLWSKGQQSQANIVKGGITLSATIHPFAFVGSTFLTNVVATPFAADLLATPSGNNNSGIGNIVTAGVNFDVLSFKNFELVSGLQYENRMGQGYWSGNYLMEHLGISRRF
jgi:hypothetical protein